MKGKVVDGTWYIFGIIRFWGGPDLGNPE